MTSADFRAIASLLPEACLLVDAEGQVLAVNPAAERLLGRQGGELEGARLFDLVSDEPEIVRAYLASAMRRREPYSGALTIAGDEDIACTCLGGLVEPADGDQPARLLLRLTEEASAAHDLRRRYEKLERRQALLEESQRSARVGSWEWDVATGELTWSDELYRLYGLDPAREAITFDQFQSLIHPDDRALVEESISRAAEDAQPFSFEHRIITPTGAVRVLHGRGRAITDENGVVVRMIGSGQDVTERRRDEDRTRFLAEAGHILTSSLDYQVTLRRVAELSVPRIADWAAVDILEEDEIRRLAIAHPDPRKLALAEEVAQRWPEDPSNPGVVTRVQRTGESLLLPEIPESLLEEQARSAEHLRILRELSLRSAMIVPLEARGQILGSITFVAGESGRRFGDDDMAFAQDLADRAALAVDNARLYQESREASRARDDLMAVVSHDLRSPLNAVLAGASLLLEVPLSDEKREDQYRSILRSAERMERLTRDLLDITRIEAGHLRIEPKPQDVRSLLEDALEGATFAAGRIGIFLSSDVRDDVPRVRADRSRVLQVLDNLLSNAIRHTSEGGRVTASAEALGDVIRFAVSDTGAGIPADIREQVFDRYCQAGRTDHGGAGLGLPIAKGIIDAHHGQIWLETTEGEGTTFFFTLPAASEHDEEDDSAVA